MSWHQLRCPACKKGALFSGVLGVVETCSHCGLSLKEHEKGDGPAFFAITIAGCMVTTIAAWIEITLQPPYWLHALLWVPLTLVLSIVVLRVSKAWLIAMQWKSQPW